jgi:hypothetical protein
MDLVLRWYWMCLIVAVRRNIQLSISGYEGLPENAQECDIVLKWESRVWFLRKTNTYSLNRTVDP